MTDLGCVQPPCVIILGMHRSGTSLLAGCLEAAGLNLGEVNNSAPFNRKGNKENESIRELNDALLARNGFAWNVPPNSPVAWEQADMELARQLIRPHLDAGLPWGFKDPRTVWTIEGWLRVLPEARIVGVFRHPSLVVASLAGRPGSLNVKKDKALELWCAYNLELIHLQEKYRFPIVHFGPKSEFHEDFIVPLVSFAQSLGLSGCLYGFFDQTLVHQTTLEPIQNVQASRMYSRLMEIFRECG